MKIKLLFTVLLLNMYLMTIAATPPNATISYNSPFCQTSALETVTLTGTGNYLGGTFLATPSGLFINAITGAIYPSSSSPGIYVISYNVAANGSDPAFSVSVAVLINPLANAGADGDITVCDSSTEVINLFSLISGEQSGGTWTRILGTGGIFDSVTGTFTPSPGATVSSFVYTIEVPLPCGSDTSVATVNITSQPNAGTNGSMTVCETSTASIDLFSLISGEQPGGTWTGIGSGGVFDPVAGTFTPALGATSTTFQYTVAPFSCASDTSFATVYIALQPNAGTDGSINVSNTTNESINLYSIISGFQPGGTWTRTLGAGGTFNAAVGTFNPYPDATSSTFTYTLQGIAPCVSDNSVVIITTSSVVVPLFTPIAALCSGSVAPSLPSVSANGITGTWTPSTIDNSQSGIYTFTPDPGQSAVLVTLSITVIPSPTATIVVPDTVIIGSPYVVGFTGTPNAIITYQYNSGTTQTIVLNNAGQATIFFENAIASTICLISASDVCTTPLSDCATVNVVEVPAPIGNPSQTFGSGATLADVVVVGENIQWYDGAGRSANSNPLPLSTVLVNGVTYYASQTSNGYESPDRLAVTVEVNLATNSFDFTNLTYGPNPVENILNIGSEDIFQKVSVYNFLGQAVFQGLCSTSDLKIDLGFLTKGNYFIKLESESKQEVIKVLKN